MSDISGYKTNEIIRIGYCRPIRKYENSASIKATIWWSTQKNQTSRYSWFMNCHEKNYTDKHTNNQLVKSASSGICSKAAK